MQMQKSGILTRRSCAGCVQRAHAPSALAQRVSALLRRRYHHSASPSPYRLAVTNPLVENHTAVEVFDRTKAPFIWGVFRSLSWALNIELPAANQVPSIAFDRTIEFVHENLRYESKVRITHASKYNQHGHRRVDSFMQVHVPNEGILYNAMIQPRHQGELYYPLEGQNAHAIVSPEFGVFAQTRFGEPPEGQNFYYNQYLNRLDIQFWFRPDKGKLDRVYLATNFEPGYPLDPFNEDEFFRNE